MLWEDVAVDHTVLKTLHGAEVRHSGAHVDARGGADGAEWIVGH